MKKHNVVAPGAAVGPAVGPAVGGAGLNTKKKFIHRPKNLRLIRGGGMVVINPQEKVSHKVFTKDKTFYELNKFIIEADALKEDGICDMRYKLNGKKWKKFKCQNGTIRDIIIDLCNNKFSLKEYGKLSASDKKFILKFCEQAHVDVGMSDSVQDAETNYKIYEGELNSGNPAPMIQFLFHSFIKGQLKKEDYLAALEQIYKIK